MTGLKFHGDDPLPYLDYQFEQKCQSSNRWQRKKEWMKGVGGNKQAGLEVKA